MIQSKHPKALVLIVVVYIVGALSMLAFALTFRSRAAIKESTFLIERIQQDKIAHAAYVQASSMLIADDDSTDSLDEPWFGRHKIIPSSIDTLSADESDWEVSWWLIDESSKINVNLAYTDILLGLEYLDEAAVASILDWIDQDDVPNPDGAENDYYTALPAGYKCKNGPLDIIEELLLIKGVSAQIYYGSNLDERTDDTTGTNTDLQNRSVGLSNLLTVYGDAKININTASKTVLDAIPLLSDAAVNEIISRQKSATGKFSSMDDIENNNNFTAADRLSLMQVAKFSSNQFQLRIRVRKKTWRFWNEYLAIIERETTDTRLLNWQRKSRTLLKDNTVYSQGLVQ